MILTLVLFFTILLYMLSDTIDDFAPKHIGISWMILNDNDDLSGFQWFFDQVPGFYIFVAELMLISGISGISISTTPILLVPYTFTFFIFVYILSKRKTYLATLLLLFMFSSSRIGTYRIFMWAAGMGQITYYVILSLVLFDRSKWQYSLLMIISLLALPFISYNLTFHTICFLIMFLVIGVRKSSFRNIENQRILILISLPFIIEFGLMRFVYNTYIPLMRGINLESNVIKSFVIFIKYLFGQSISQGIIIKEFAISIPKEIMTISIFKYATLSFFTLLSLKTIYKQDLQKGGQNANRLFLSLLGVAFFFVVFRAAIGGLAATVLFFPSIVAITILCNHNRQGVKYRKLVYSALIVLVITNFTVISLSHQSGLVQKDDYSYIRQSANWVSRYVTSDVFFPDQLTSSWFYFQFCYLDRNLTRGYLGGDDILAIYTGDDISHGKIIIINYRTNYNAIGGWTALKSFRYFRYKIETNPSVQGKIYSLNEDIVIIITQR